MKDVRPRAGLIAALALVVVWAAIEAAARLGWTAPPAWIAPHLEPVAAILGWPSLAALTFVVIAAGLFQWPGGLGLAAGSPGADIRLMAAPLVYLAGVAALAVWRGGVPVPQTLSLWFVRALALGFATELALRGILFCGLSSRLRIWPTIALALAVALLVAPAEHLDRLMDPATRMAGLYGLAASAMGAVLYVALRVRSGSIWPAVLVAGVSGAALGMLQSSGPRGADAIAFREAMPALMMAPALVYGLFLLRRANRGAPKGGVETLLVVSGYFLASGVVAYLMPAAQNTAEGPLAFLPVDGIHWALVASTAFLVLAALILRRPDVGFTRLPPARSIALLWLPFLYVAALCGAAIAVGLPPTRTILICLLTAVLVGFSEEIFFRGFLLGWLRNRMRLWPAALLATALFGIVHVSNALVTGNLAQAILQAVATTMIGLALAGLRLRSGSLALPMVFHAAWDFSLLVLLTSVAGSMAAAGTPAQTPEIGIAAALPVLALVLPLFFYGFRLVRAAAREEAAQVIAPAGISSRFALPEPLQPR